MGLSPISKRNLPTSDLLEIHLYTFDHTCDTTRDFCILQSEEGDVVTRLFSLPELAAIYQGVISGLLEQFRENSGGDVVLLVVR